MISRVAAIFNLKLHQPYKRSFIAAVFSWHCSVSGYASAPRRRHPPMQARARALARRCKFTRRMHESIFPRYGWFLHDINLASEWLVTSCDKKRQYGSFKQYSVASRHFGVVLGCVPTFLDSVRIRLSLTVPGYDPIPVRWFRSAM